jgi:hypothetical protein
MAQPVRRVRRSDGVIFVQIKWREGGRGSAWQSVTFARGTTAQNEARAMAFVVEVKRRATAGRRAGRPTRATNSPGRRRLPRRPRRS